MVIVDPNFEGQPHVSGGGGDSFTLNLYVWSGAALKWLVKNTAIDIVIACTYAPQVVTIGLQASGKQKPSTKIVISHSRANLFAFNLADLDEIDLGVTQQWSHIQTVGQKSALKTVHIKLEKSSQLRMFAILPFQYTIL